MGKWAGCIAAGPGWDCDRVKIHAWGLCKAHYKQDYAGRALTPIGETRRLPRKRGACGPGESWCFDCEKALPTDRFAAYGPSRGGELRSYCKDCSAARKWSEKYKVSGAQQGTLLAGQGNSCAFPGCGRTDPRAWHMDHAHSCCPEGKSCGSCVRGVLCPSCNMHLVAGYEALPREAQTWPEMNAYLRRRPIEVMLERRNYAAA